MMSMKATTRALPRIAARGLMFILVWWALTDGVAASWWIGAPAVALALAASLALRPPALFSWFALLRFIPFFVVRSVLGGVDVARRAFQPAMPLAPDLVEYPLRLPPGTPRVFLAAAVNLLPGTLSAAFRGDVLQVHVLDRHGVFAAELETVERHVARMFGTGSGIVKKVK